MTREELHSEICNHIYQRTSWETNQAIWYQMRHDGVGRKNPPFPGAANLHFPLADTQINKLKPFYYKQIYGNELIASFVPYKQENTQLARLAEQYFNYKIRYHSDLLRESQLFTDKMLQSGQSVCKILFNHDKGHVVFSAIDPLAFIISPKCRHIQHTDMCVEVIKMTVDEYKSHDEYNQDESFVASITGNTTTDIADKQQLGQLKNIREGFTVSCENNEIIIWEVYRKEYEETEKDGEKTKRPFWKIYTYSPKNISQDVKEPYELPYDHGKLPYVQFEFEIKDKGFYSSRGIPAYVAMEETYLTKLMNEKYDAITLINRPIYSLVGNPIPNMETVMMKPGQVVPYELKAIVNPPPPIDFDKEMMLVRQNAEQRIASPDLGMQREEQRNTEPRTAREISLISNLSDISTELRSAIFRESLTELYRQAWSLMCQYADKDFEFYFREEMKSADESILKEKYLIMPSGGVDSYNRQFQVQKATQLFQMFRGDPFIKQDELRKNILEQFDPRLIARFYQDANTSQTNEQEEQGLECLLLEQGFPATVKPTDNPVIHIMTMIHRLQMLQQTGHTVSPLILKMYLMHANDHFYDMKQQKIPQFEQLEQQFKQVMLGFTGSMQGAVPPRNGNIPPQGQNAIPTQMAR